LEGISEHDSARLVSWMRCALLGSLLAACDAPPQPTTQSAAPPLPSSAPAIVRPSATARPAGDPALGKRLFHEIGCARCHDPARGWADGQRFSRRADGTDNTRNTPSLLGIGEQPVFGWDGRATSLEEQIAEELTVQLGITRGDSDVAALAAYVRTLRGESAFERFEKGDTTAISPEAQRGWLLFRNKAGCAACHVPPLFTDHRFHNLGVGYPSQLDAGRQRATSKPADRGKMKTPSLRAAAASPPYFHDGSARTLAEAVDYVLSGGSEDPLRDSGITRIDLSADERKELVAFIESLADAAPP
jgi:cytochrome c peroxidase